MKKEQLSIMNDISQIEKKQSCLLEKVRSSQQQLFHIFAQRHLLKQKMMHRQLEDVLEYLPGSFGHTALYILYLDVCLEMKIELNPDHHPLLKRLIDWSELFPVLQGQASLSFVFSVTTTVTLQSFKCFEEYITYLNFIGADLIKLIRRSKVPEDRIAAIDLSHINIDDLIQFLLNSIPKILFNIILPKEVLPPQYKEFKSMEILYRSTDLEFFVRSKPFYATLVKILIKMLIKLELKPGQQKSMMEIVFRYFYCFHHDKKYVCTDIFIEAYNVIPEAVRFAMADEFVLFFRVIKKVGKGKFCDFLLGKSQWLKTIDVKVAEGNFVGYAKESLNPFPTLKVFQTILVPNGKIQQRTFEILQDYSLFYFIVEVESYDVTIRLSYLGEFGAEKAVEPQLLLNYEKKSGMMRANVMAAKKGIYQFEFDNSYSWVNGKVVKLEKVVLMPLEFRSADTPKWVGSYYENVELNHLADQSKIMEITKIVEPVHQESKPSAEGGQGNISKDGKFFSMIIKRGSNVYEFESESEDRLVRKFNQIVELGGRIKWMIGGEPLEDSDELAKMLKIPVEKKKKQKKKENETSAQGGKKEEKTSEAEPEKKEQPQNISSVPAAKKQESVANSQQTSSTTLPQKQQPKEQVEN